jgi:NAD(P)-dependent dehydrogenase (short-subunit alcohol dehydrogenase family)
MNALVSASKDSPPVVLVTGSTDGIGLTTARLLLEGGARVILHGRSEARLEAARADLERVAAGRLLRPLRADLASLAEVRAMAAELLARDHGVDVVLHNAGVFEKTRRTSADGFELTMAVNHYAPFVLTHALLAGGARLSRVVNVSSVAHARGRLDLDDLDFQKRGFEGYAAYATSKLANVLFTTELARRTRARGLAVNALHPGVVGTKLLREGFGMEGNDTPEEASATSVHLALSKEGGAVSGAYFVRCKEARTSGAASDADLARRFYEKSAERTGVAPLPL